ncbi:hypothetical protein SAY87_010392 [Trapa incisa]|uniref:Uncharacterized protein n=1 Tax=Trapa incisa TaxID=236973 RepID=A0AAN7GE42_9MYRT|nr:hypothetical protein SAY87_010392 [Trapa incisa]
MSSRSVHQRIKPASHPHVRLGELLALDHVYGSSLIFEHTNNWWFCSIDTTDAIIYFKAHNLHDISGDYRRKLSDATLSLIVIRHELLECLQLGLDFCERITSDAIKAMAICCNKLKKLRLSRIMDVQGDAIDALAKYCPKLIGVGFLDCLKVDEMALRTSNLKWGLVSHMWHKLPNLIDLDVSRTDIGPAAISRLLVSSQNSEVPLKFPFSQVGYGKAYVEVLVINDGSKRVLHVQSISCWAPSCIGLYS